LETGKKYRFSFTAGSLLLEEMKLVVDAMAAGDVALNDLDHIIIKKGRRTTSKREFAGLKLRIHPSIMTD